MLSAKPLADLTVLEIGHSIAGPYAGMIFAELGATVVKVEQPGGDYARDWGPPFVAGAASAFQAVNRGKKGIVVDLKDENERERLETYILSDVDIVIHNLKFGALEKLGLDPETLLEKKPSLIHCNIGAFGRTGPYRDRPGYDPLMQAFGGLMSILGEPGSPPSRVAVSIIDMGAGLWAAIGVLAAVHERSNTGRGGVVDTSLCETSLSWMAVPIAAYMCSGIMQEKTGSANHQIVPYQAFETSDGYLMVAAGNDNLFSRLANCIGLPSLANDPRFVKNADRVVNRSVLIPVLEKQFSTKSRREWSKKLEAAGVPTGPIQTVDEVVGHDQVKALNMIQPSPDGVFSTVGLPLSFDGVRPAFERAAPELGEHSDAILGRGKP